MPRFFDPFSAFQFPPMYYIIHHDTPSLTVIESDGEWLWNFWDEAVQRLDYLFMEGKK